MNTKFGKSESGQALVVTILLLALIVIGMLIVMDGVGHNPFAVITAHAMGVNVRESFVLKGQVYYALRGDCFADRASNDFYATPDNDIVCKSSYFVMSQTNGAKDDTVKRAVAIQPAAKHHKHNQPVVNETVAQPAAVDNVDKPADKPQDKQEKGNPGNHKPVGNAGEDPNSKGTMSLDSTDGNGEHGNQGQNGNKAGEVLGGFIFVTFKKGRKEYKVTVSSFSYDLHNNLWLYIWEDEKKGVKGNCGYVPNGKVVSACDAICSCPYVNKEAQEVIKTWYD